MRQMFIAGKTKMAIAIGVALTLGACGGGGDGDSGQNVAGISVVPARTVTSLNQQGWKFMLDGTNSLSNTSATDALANGGEAVTLPHTWNATDAASTSAITNYYRGIGWYRLDFNTSVTAPVSGCNLTRPALSPTSG
jgi:beta-galactosidase